MTNVRDFIKRLEEFDQEAEVILATDAEGNSFHTLDDISVAKAFGKGYEVEVLFGDEDDDDYSDPTYPVIVIWP